MNKTIDKKTIKKGLLPYLFLALIMLGVFYVVNVMNNDVNVLTYNEFMSELNKGNIEEVQITARGSAYTYEVRGSLKDYDSNETFFARLPLSDEVMKKIVNASEERNFKLEAEADPDSSSFWLLVINVLPFVLLIGFAFFFFSRQMAGNKSSMDFGKSKARLNSDANKVTFKDVAGLKEEKEEVKELIDFLKNPKKFQKLGARIPKGVLLFGPPGTGKTLLAKAVAGEANVPFYFISGSDFVELFVGVGASRVRDMFQQAKRNAPCLIFIDEIDAVGRQRGTGLGGGHDEREQTLNQLLVEMDGFAANEGIIIIAATNRPDILDPALLRPGRFDRQIVVDRPDVRGREAILKVHTKGKPVDSDVNLDVLARRTPGFTGADLSNLVNEAALLSARRNKKTISMNSLEESIERVIAGPERKSKVISDREKRLTAYHEGGHALIGLLLPNADPVHKVTIIPRGRAGGYTLMLPKEDRSYATRGELLDRLKTMLGGRVAEEVVLKEISTGASNDIQQASGLVRSMITQYGMSDVLGPIAFGDGQDHQVFLGRDFNNQRNYSEDVACAIDKEVRRYIEEAYDECRKLLIENIDKLHLIAKALIEKETLEEKDLKIIMETGSLEGVCEIKEANSEEKETSTTEEVKNAEVVEEKQADAVAKEPAISTTEKI